MNRFLVQTVLVAGLFAAILAGDKVYSTLTPYAEAQSIGRGVVSFSDLSERFVELAEHKGAPYAFSILLRADLPQNTDLHLLGHAVGDILYRQQGIGGIAACTQDFRNACSHSIVIGALTEFNASDEVLRVIDDACKKAPGGSGAYTMCYHGLGHGVFAFFGYDLDDTVAFCGRMGTAEYRNEQYTQCVGGAVMELMGGGGHDREQWLLARERYLAMQEPLAPCDTALVPAEAKTFCYMYLTPRLLELAGANLGTPNPNTFPRAFSFCDAIPTSNPRNREACFGGFGKEFVPLAGARDIRRIDHLPSDAYARAIQWCQLAGVTDGAEACITEGLESVFWGGEADPAASVRYCGVSPEEFRRPCLTTLASSIKRYFDGAVQEQWCAQLPEEYYSQCAV